MKERTPAAIAHDLMRAWEEEQGPLASPPDTDLGDGVRRLLIEALDNGTFREVVLACKDFQQTSALGVLQREAERLACHDFYPPSMQPQAVGRECALFALPVMGATEDMDAWLRHADHKHRLEHRIKSHLSDFLNIPENRLEKVFVFNGLMMSSTIAALTPDARRALMHEMLQIPQRADVPSIVTHLQENSPFVLGTPGFLSEALVVVAVVARTDWEAETAMAHRLTDWVTGQTDEDTLIQGEATWMGLLDTLGLPAETLAGQPVSVNEALMQTLRSYLFSARVQAHALAGGGGLGSDPPRLPAIETFTVFQTPDGDVVIEARTEEGEIPRLVVSPHWAMTEGQEAWQQALMESFDIDQTLNPIERLDAVPEPADPYLVMGDHPAWRHAHPTPRQVH